MILSKKVIINITNRNISHYSNLYGDIKIGELEINVDELIKSSCIEVNIKCDFCNTIKMLSYKSYIKNISKHNLYACSNKCAVIKGEMTCLEKYGSKYALQSEDIKNNLKEYFIDKFGYYNPSKNEDVKLKRENTMLERFGVKTNLILPDTHKKAVDLSCTEESKEKRIETNIERYGVDNYTKTEEYLIRTKETNNKLYGFSHPMKSQIIKDRLKNTFVERYGVEHPMMLKEFALKAGKESLKSKIKNGIAIDKTDITKWHNYRDMVRKLTHNNKKELFENWSGFDYYDNEYIINNLSLSHIDEDYPCVDHKISLLYGFKNSIPIEEISKIENLCITKRKINSNKKSSNEEDFLLKLKIVNNV